MALMVMVTESGARVDNQKIARSGWKAIWSKAITVVGAVIGTLVVVGFIAFILYSLFIHEGCENALSRVEQIECLEQRGEWPR